MIKEESPTGQGGAQVIVQQQADSRAETPPRQAPPAPSAAVMSSGPLLITETERINQIKASALSASELAVLEEDKARRARLGGGAHLDEWLEFHPGLVIRRRFAMRIAFTNRPEGKSYALALNQLYVADGFDVTDKVLMKTLSDVLWLGDEHHPERMAILNELRARHDLG